ncbi:MAG: matrixin family metalloprotease [Polyangiaceae bacterium]
MKSFGLLFLVSLGLVASAGSAFADAPPRTVDSGKAEKWASGTITVVLDASLDDVDPHGQDAVLAAFGTWMSGAHVSKVVVNRTSEHGVAAHDGVNRILVAPITIAGHEKDVAVTISYADSKTGVIGEADTIFNSKYAFAVLDASDESDVSHDEECGKKYDIQNVATHEFGHFFGLSEDVGDENATMFITSAPCQTHKRELTSADVASMSSLYPQSSESAVAPDLVTASPACAVSRVPNQNESDAPLFLLAAACAFMIRRGNGIRTSRASSRCNRSK